MNKSELLMTIQFLMNQIEKLARNYMSEGAGEWLAKNDAMNCGKHAIAKLSSPKPGRST